MILAIDLGSTGIRSIVVNHEGKIVAYAYRRIGQFYPRIGWSEHDLDDIWTQCLGVCSEVLRVRLFRPTFYQRDRPDHSEKYSCNLGPVYWEAPSPRNFLVRQSGQGSLQNLQ